ncbi:MAG: DNA methyltransferase [Candidatus Acidiferrales bacterium]
MPTKTAKDRRRSWWQETPKEVHRLPQGDIVCADALVFLKSLRKESADIVFLDPPFNLGKSYGNNGAKADSLTDEKYLEYMTAVINQSVHVLRTGGALYLYHIPRWAFRLAGILQPSLAFRHWIAVSMKNGFPRGNFLYPAHYALLYFTKGKPQTFKRPKIRAPRCRHCHKYIRDYGGYERFVRNGINLSDVWDDVSPVRHKKYKHRVSNELPLSIPRRAVQISGGPGKVLVDPFVGAGTSLVAAVEKRMRFVACDIEDSFCEVTSNRLNSLRTPQAPPSGGR